MKPKKKTAVTTKRVMKKQPPPNQFVENDETSSPEKMKAIAALEKYTPDFEDLIGKVYRSSENRDSPRFAMLYCVNLCDGGASLEQLVYSGDNRQIAEKLDEVAFNGFEPPFPAGTNQRVQARSREAIDYLLNFQHEPGWVPVVRMFVEHGFVFLISHTELAGFGLPKT